MPHQKRLAIIAPAPEPRKLLQEKRLKNIGVRVPESFKGYLDQRASSRNRNLSQHMLDLAIADLETQAETRLTLSNAAAELARVVELAQQGIENDVQRIWVLKRVAVFQMAVLEIA